MMKFLYYAIFFFTAILLSCDAGVMQDEKRSINNVFSEKDSSVCIFKKDIHEKVCTTYVDKNLDVIKSINYYSVEGKKSWVRGVSYFQEGHIDSSILVHNGLFVLTKRYDPNGDLYEISENFHSNGNVNQFWYFEKNGKLMEDYGCSHEIFVCDVDEKHLRFQILNVHEPNCMGDISLDLNIGIYDDDFKNITDSSGFQIIEDIKLMDTISIEIEYAKKELRYIMKIQCEEYTTLEGDNYNNVMVPISGVLTW